MRLYINAKTNISDLKIDYIEVLLQSGEQVSLNWDWSDYWRDKSYFSARFKGVYFGEEYANGRCSVMGDDELDDMLRICDKDLHKKLLVNVD